MLTSLCKSGRLFSSRRIRNFTSSSGPSSRFQESHHARRMYQESDTAAKKVSRLREKQLSSLFTVDSTLDPVLRPNPSKTVQTLLNTDLDQNFTIFQYKSELESLLLLGIDDLDYARFDAFCEAFDTSKIDPTRELIVSLIKTCLKYSDNERAVAYYSWGRDCGVLPSAAELLSLIRIANTTPGWNAIRRKLIDDLYKYYPNYTESSDHDLTQDPESNSANVNWIDFITNPTSHSNENIVADLAISQDEIAKQMNDRAMRRLTKKNMIKLGDREKRIQDEFKFKTDLELKLQPVTDNVILTALTSEYIRREKVQEALEVLKSLQNDNNYDFVSVSAFLPLATYYRESKDVPEMMNLLQMMMKMQVPPDISFLNTILELHVSLKNWDSAEQLYSKLSEFSVSPNMTTINIMIDALAEMKSSGYYHSRSVHFIGLIRHAKHKNMTFTDQTYTNIVKYALATDDHELAVRSFEKIVSPNANAYISLMSSYGRVKKFHKVLYLLHQFTQSVHGNSSVEHLISIVNICIDNRKTDSAPTLLRFFQSKLGILPPTSLITKLIPKMLQNGDWDQALEVEKFRREFMKEMGIPKLYCYAFLKSPQFMAAASSLPKAHTLSNSIKKILNLHIGTLPKELERDWLAITSLWILQTNKLKRTTPRRQDRKYTEERETELLVEKQQQQQQQEQEEQEQQQ